MTPLRLMGKYGRLILIRKHPCRVIREQLDLTGNLVVYGAMRRLYYPCGRQRACITPIASLEGAITTIEGLKGDDGRFMRCNRLRLITGSSVRLLSVGSADVGGGIACRWSNHRMLI